MVEQQQKKRYENKQNKEIKAPRECHINIHDAEILCPVSRTAKVHRDPPKKILTDRFLTQRAIDLKMG